MMGELIDDEKGEAEAKRTSLFSCLRNLSIVTSAISIAFIGFLALWYSGYGYYSFASIFLAIIYLIYRAVR